MSLKKEFDRKLDALLSRRVDGLRRLVHGRRKGRSVSFSRGCRDKLISELLSDAVEISTKREGHSEFQVVTRARRLWKIKGRGLAAKGAKLVEFSNSYLKTPIVYTFWRGKKCLYVGKGNNGKRLRNYDKSAYLSEATCLEVFAVRSMSLIPKAECLAIHLFKPRDNKVKAGRQKWGKKCPVCRIHDTLRSQLVALLRMK